VACHHLEVARPTRQAQGDELPQTAGAHDQNVFTGEDGPLLRDAQGRRQGLAEDGGLVREGVGDGVQVGEGQDQVFGKGAIMVLDAQHPAPGAVMTPPGPAGVAVAAGQVDLANDPFPPASGLVRRGGDFTDELVAGDAGEGVIALPQFQVCRANAGQAHPHQGLPRTWHRYRQVLA
jgi:hypothetical protein